MSPDSIPARLRSAIDDDSQPIRPLHPVWVRIMLAVAVTVVVLAFVLANASLRTDMARLPMWLSWGAAALQLGFGLALIGLALRESVPGAGVPGGVVRSAAVAALAVQVFVGIATSIYSPAAGLPVHGIASGMGCFTHEAFMALPTFVITLLLVFRALPLRAPIAGLLGGAGATVASDAVIHLVCPTSNLSHVLIWHSGAVVFFMAVGWLVGFAWQRWRWPNGS